MMKRYFMGCLEAIQNPKGDFVRYDDVEAEIARLRAANAELSVTIQKLRKALTYYAEQEYNPSRADDGVIAREALK